MVAPTLDTGATDPTAAQTAAAKAKADAALADLQAGKDWETVAKSVSTDTASAPQGGDSAGSRRTAPRPIPRS